MFDQKISLSCLIVALISVSLTNVESFDVENDLRFRLYTRDDRENYYAMKSAGSLTGFNPNKPTRIFIHGFKSKEKVIHRYKDAYLNVGDYNYIAVDWTEGANTYNYFAAKSHIGAISIKLAELLDTLVEVGMDLKNVTIVGHSLGAHIAGRAAKLMKSPDKIAVIIGLDPAGVALRPHEREQGLVDTDADYVQVIHTDGSKFGTLARLGHADIYPNGGTLQPGCTVKNYISYLMDKCSHVRSHHLFFESLNVPFPAIQCASVEEIQEGNCTNNNNVIGYMGGDITASAPKAYGVFYLETKAESPYVIPDYRDFDQIRLTIDTHL